MKTLAFQCTVHCPAQNSGGGAVDTEKRPRKLSVDFEPGRVDQLPIQQLSVKESSVNDPILAIWPAMEAAQPTSLRGWGINE